jgi:hypothetical protein
MVDGPSLPRVREYSSGRYTIFRVDVRARVPIAEVREYSSMAGDAYRKMTSEINLTFYRGDCLIF